LKVRARPQLREQVESQGRRYDWIADRLGVSKSFISKVVSGTRPISEADARVFAALINGDFRVLFDLPEERDSLPSGRISNAAD
jgi:transcriptional regulator with XRE-family HTH domain